MKVRKGDEVKAPDVKLETPINVGVMKELREYQSKLGFKNVTDNFELANSRPLFFAQSPVPDHNNHADYPVHGDHGNHALHCDSI